MPRFLRVGENMVINLALIARSWETREASGRVESIKLEEPDGTIVEITGPRIRDFLDATGEIR
jgi:hypothetical protein